MSLTEARQEALGRIDRLKAARGAAVLDGDAFDDAELRHAEAELTALDDAEAELTRRQRAAAADEWSRLRQGLMAELKKRDAARLDAVDRFQTAACEMVAALNDVLDESDAERAAFNRLGIQILPGLTEPELCRRLSIYLGSVLSTIRRHPRRFSGLQWFFTGSPQPSDWAEAEAKAVDIATIEGS